MPTQQELIADLRRLAVETHGVDARPELIAYSMACKLLRIVLGDDWVERNLFRAAKGDPFLESGSEQSDQRWLYQYRVIHLAELVFHLRFAKGADDRLARLSSVDLEAAIVELEGAEILYRAGIPFEFVNEQGKHGEDYDGLALPLGGPKVACEMKCKKIETDCSEGSFTRSLKKARAQLPYGLPGVAFLRIPEAWASDRSAPEWMETAIHRVFGSTTRLAGLVLFWDRWLVLPSGSRISGEMIHVYRNQNSPHVADVGAHLFDKLEEPESGQKRWFDFLQVASVSIESSSSRQSAGDDLAGEGPRAASRRKPRYDRTIPSASKRDRMKPPEGQKRESKRTRQFAAVIALLFVGLIGLWGMGATAFERYRPVDTLRLLASGACFGAAIVIIVGIVRRPRGA